MRRAYLKGDVFALLVLAVFPLIAYIEPLLEHRLLGPGDGVALHLPLRTEAFRAYRDFSLPLLNTREFLGTPLLAAYRGGVLYPLTILLAPFDPFSAFQALVVISLSLTGILTFLYLKRLGVLAPGAFVAALSFAYGPYLLGHFEDTATLVAAPMLPLVLLTAESHMNRATASRLIGLAVSFALLVLAGSPEALRAGGALLFGRLLLGHTLSRSPRTPGRLATGLALALGLALSAPQWLPTLDLLPSTGRQVTGLLAERGDATVSGLAGLILKTVTHTPAASLALASLPLLFDRQPVRVLLLAVLASLALQVGRGPLLAPSALSLVLEFALAALAGLALDEQWKERRTRRGRRLRAYFLVASLASVAVLSIAAATLGGLPERLAAAVGVYALALIIYFALADASSSVAAGVFLLPLAVSFALQPSGREVFKEAPTRSQLVSGTPTRRAVDRALSELQDEPRVLTLVRDFPTELALDLGFAGYGALLPRVQANGYDPMAPQNVRHVLGEMGARGFLTERSLTPDVERLRRWSIDAVQVRTADLVRGEGDEKSEILLESGTRRVFALPFLRFKSIHLEFVEPSTAMVQIFARVNGDRDVPIGALPATPPTASLAVPAYRADTVTLEVAEGADHVRLAGISVETTDGVLVRPSALSVYLSQPAFKEIATTPQIRVFRVLSPSPAESVAPPSRRSFGVGPGGHLSVNFSGSSRIPTGLPYLEGWRVDAAMEDDQGQLVVEKSAGVAQLRYAPPLLPLAVALALTALGAMALFLARPTILGGLLKSRRDERK